MRWVVLIAVFALAAPAGAEVYRFVDENGVVTFTDQPPGPGAEPMDLPPITVIETRTPSFTPPPSLGDAASGGQAYADLRFFSPQPEETFQGTGNSLSVRLQSATPLRPGDRVVLFLDQVRQGEFATLAVNLDGIPRGTHTVRAEILSQGGQVLAGAGPVTFFMKQHSQLHNQGPLAFPSQVPPGR